MQNVRSSDERTEGAHLQVVLTGVTTLWAMVRCWGEEGSRKKKCNSPDQQMAAGCNSSVREDPAMRRSNGGGHITQILHLLPMSLPEIVVTENGPAITHADMIWTIKRSGRLAEQGPTTVSNSVAYSGAR